VVVLEGGNSLGAATPARSPDDAAQRLAKARLIADAWRMVGVDAVALGANDWALGGVAEVRAIVADLPVVAANLACDGASPYPASVVVERGGRRVGVVGVTAGQVTGCTVGEPVAAIRAALDALPPVDVRVVLAPLDTVGLGAIGAAGLGDLVVDGGTGKTRQGPEPLGSGAAPLVLSVGARTKVLGVLKVDFVDGATGFVVDGALARAQQDVERARARLATARERVTEQTDPALVARYEAQIVHFEKQVAAAEARLTALDATEGVAHRLTPSDRPLSKDIVDHPETAARVAEVLAGLGPGEGGHEATVARLVSSGPYLGADGCRGCHPAAYAQWSSTPHASALASLAKSKRSYDLECWSCHVTGANLDGGPAAPAAIGPFHGVQCEACHGPGRAHAANPGGAAIPVASPEAGACTGCHDGERDEGRFDPATYLPKVVHE
jgi:hypothetical protein